MADALSEFGGVLRKWREDPVAFVRECLGAEPDPKQAEALRAFPTTNRLAMKASKGTGKTTTEAWLAWNFLATRPRPKIAATSITGDNLTDNLWPEMSKWQSRSTFLKDKFEWTKTRIFAKEHPEEWFMSARTWPKSGDAQKQADTLAGLHADYIMFLLDESGGIPRPVMATAEAALASGVECKIVQAGNPTDLFGPLHDACVDEAHLWVVVEMTGDPDDPNRSARVSIDWAREQIAKYGRDNPWVLVNVFGKFPPAGMNSLIGVEEIKLAMKRRLRPEMYNYQQKRLGVDVARFGGDPTIIFPRQGKRAFMPVEMKNASTDMIAARVIMAKNKWGSEMEYVDDTGGWGAGVIDQMALGNYTAIPVNYSSRAIDPRYMNRRAEMYFLAVAHIKAGGALPEVPELIAEFTAPTYTFVNGKFQLMDKDQIRDLIGRSPNYADAYVQTFFHPEAPSAKQPNDPLGIMRGVIESNGNKVNHDFDPYREKEAA